MANGILIPYLLDSRAFVKQLARHVKLWKPRAEPGGAEREMGMRNFPFAFARRLGYKNGGIGKTYGL
jgi:hypothetical protein